jgi:hypothetical protein
VVGSVAALLFVAAPVVAIWCLHKVLPDV